MITLFHCINARSFRPLWMLEELGVPYDLRMLPFPPRAKARSFLAENPLGAVPFMRDGSMKMTESAAMCEYLAARYRKPGSRLDFDASDPAFGDYLNFLHFGEATLTFLQTLLQRYGRFEPADRRNPQVVSDYERWFVARLKLLDAQLSYRRFLCGRFSAADVSVGYALFLAEHLGLQTQFPAAASDYLHQLKDRAAFARSLGAQASAADIQGVPLTPAPEVDLA